MIHIITFLNTYNYGSVLQAYALNNYMNDRGYKTKTIYYDLNSLKNNNLISIIPIYVFKLLNFKSNYIRTKKFYNFINQYIQLEEKKFTSYQELLDYKFDINDTFIVGSDQCWCELDRNAFFLDFVDSNNKFSYAVSLGDGLLQKKDLCYIEKKIKNFKNISFREKYDVKEFSNISLRKSEYHIDPVFLIDKKNYVNISYQSKLRNKKIEKYILIYTIKPTNKMVNYIKSLIEVDTAIVLVGGSRKKINDFRIQFYKDVGVEDFLYLINNSKLIIADSFHAIAFSIIFNKDFFAFTHNDTHTRIHNLLEIFNLKSRINPVQGTIYNKIDYTKVNDKILHSEVIENSKKYLDNIGQLINE